MAKAKRQHKYEPDYAVAPGETLRDTLESLGMAQKELAKRAGLTVQTISRILNGEQPITFETANKLEMVTGIPARMWNGLEMKYREQLSKIEERKRLEEDLAWLKSIPTRELVKRDILPETKDKVTLLHETLSFFGVSSVDAWNDVWMEHDVAARRSQCFESQPGAIAAWIRLGELRAQRVDCNAYSKVKFERALRKIRLLSVKDPCDFLPELIEICAACGVAVALVPTIKKSPWNGACRWLTPTKVMIQLSDRGKKDDQFWFSFFHEASHVLHDSKKDMFINDGSEDDPREIRANKFAADFLFPKEHRSLLKKIKSRMEIEAIASKLKISPGIVVGQFQRETGKYYFQKMKKTIDFLELGI